MTTIAYRDGVMAGDRRVTSHSSVEHQATKIFRRNDGALIGLAGSMPHCRAFSDWFLAGEIAEAKPVIPHDKEFEALIARPNGAVEWHCPQGWMRCEGDVFAIGSGGRCALGAMDMGATARQAVEIACRRDTLSGDGVDVVSVDSDAWIATRAA